MAAILVVNPSIGRWRRGSTPVKWTRSISLVAIGTMFPMRRQLRPLWFPAPGLQQQKQAEKLLIQAAQKGCLDFPAIVHGPIENFLISYLCRTSITPNQLTLSTNIVAWAATFCFAAGHLIWGTILALAVGILDGLDGKQARIKIETSKIGKLEHTFDAIFEHSWWIAIAYYLQTSGRLSNALVYLLLLMGGEGACRTDQVRCDPFVRPDARRSRRVQSPCPAHRWPAQRLHMDFRSRPRARETSRSVSGHGHLGSCHGHRPATRCPPRGASAQGANLATGTHGRSLKA